jgi:two-component system sensor histidine kinase KdpD
MHQAVLDMADDTTGNPADTSGLSPEKEFDEDREQIHRNMLFAVSHDLKTPLSSIIGSLQIYEKMKDRLTPEKKEVLIMTALQEAFRLDNFISNILDMAKLEGGMIKPRLERTNLGLLLQDCAGKFSHRNPLPTLHVHASQSEAIVFMTDPVLLSRCVMLLLDNASKYSGIQPEIFLEHQAVGKGRATIRVRDKGPGIPPEKLEEVFSKYSRIARRDHQNAGTGLGLAICQGIMKTLGGSVKAENYPQGGAVFTLTVPLGVEHSK